MADITTTWGVKIDPTEAKKGASEAERAADKMAKAITDDLNKIDTASRKPGKGFDAMANKARAASRTSGQAFNEMANVLGMMNGRLGMLIGQATRGLAAVSNLGRGLRGAASASQGAAVGMKGMAAAAKGLAVVVGTLTVVLGVLLVAVLAVVAAFKAFSFIVETIKVGTRLAAEAESAEVGFAVLLGSIEAARDRMEELEKFSASTPFQLPDIVIASRQMQVFTDGALAVGDGLRLVGDAAAGVNKPISEVSTWIGRLYAGLKGGQPVGEATARLLELGLLTPSVKGQLDKLSQSANENGKAFEQLWGLATQELEKFKGSMSLQSRTFDGLVSTMKDNWNLLRQDIGEPVRDALKPMIEDIISLLQDARKFVQAEVVPVIANLADSTAAVVRSVFRDGNLDMFIAAASDTFNQLMSASIKTLGQLFMSVFDQVMWDIAKSFEDGIFDAATTGAWIGGMKAAMKDIVAVFTGDLVGAVQKILPLLGPLGAGLAPAVDGMKPGGGNLAAFAKDRAAAASSGERPVILKGDELAKAFKDNMPDNTDNQKTALAVLELEKLNIENQRKADDANINKVAANAPAPAIPGLAALIAGTGDAKKKAGGGGGSKTNPLDSEASRVLESIKTPADKFNDQVKLLEKLRDTGRLTAEQFSKAIGLAEEDYADSVQRMANATENLANRNMTAMQRMMADWGDLATQVDEVTVAATQSFTGGLSGAIADLATGSKTAKEAFSEMADSIIKDITRMVAQMLVQYAVQQLVGMATGGVSNVAAAAVPVAAVVAHGGGTVGGSGMGSRRVPASTFSGAPRFHGGGTVGGERAAILQDGEEVLTEREADSMRRRLAGEETGSGSGGQAVQIINVTDPNAVLEVIAANPNAIINTLSRRRTELRHLVGSGVKG